MYKRHIVILLVFISIYPQSFGQNENTKTLWTNNFVELSGTYDLFYKGVGFLVKGKSEVFVSNHFEGYTGIAIQFSRQDETDLLIASGIEGGSNDIGFYGVFNLDCYPFKRKTFFIGLEPFIGVTNLKSKGTLELPEYEISESYLDSYTYFNYGLTPKIGYSFGRIRTDIFSMVSLKGFLDNGRKRPGDMDSRILIGVNFSYKLKPVN